MNEPIPIHKQLLEIRSRNAESNKGKEPACNNMYMARLASALSGADIAPSTKCVLMRLCLYYNPTAKGQGVHVTQQQLAHDCGVSKRTVERAIASAAHLGLLRWVKIKRPGTTDRAHNSYDLRGIDDRADQHWRGQSSKLGVVSDGNMADPLPDGTVLEIDKPKPALQVVSDKPDEEVKIDSVAVADSAIQEWIDKKMAQQRRAFENSADDWGSDAGYVDYSPSKLQRDINAVVGFGEKKKWAAEKTLAALEDMYDHRDALLDKDVPKDKTPIEHFVSYVDTMRWPDLQFHRRKASWKETKTEKKDADDKRDAEYWGGAI
jgi:hypothetical protein